MLAAVALASSTGRQLRADQDRRARRCGRRPRRGRAAWRRGCRCCRPPPPRTWRRSCAGCAARPRRSRGGRLPQASRATRLSDGLMKRMNSGLSWLSSGVAALGVGARGVVPGVGIARLARGPRRARRDRPPTRRWAPGRHGDRGVAAMAVGAAQLDRRVQVHGLGVGGRVAGDATGALGRTSASVWLAGAGGAGAAGRPRPRAQRTAPARRTPPIARARLDLEHAMNMVSMRFQ